MRFFSVLFSIVAFGLVCYGIGSTIYADYDYHNRIGSNWELADKSSTLEAKSEYMDKFVNALSAEGLQGSYNAVVFKTPDNSFDYNFKAVKSLQTRLEEARSMDPNSFAYQQAISQITAQEQGEASDMLATIKGCWTIKKHPFMWGWHGFLSLIGICLVAFFAFAFNVVTRENSR